MIGCERLCHEEAVHALQLLLGQDEAVRLLLTAGAGDHHLPHQHRAALLLLFSLRHKHQVINMLCFHTDVCRVFVRSDLDERSRGERGEVGRHASAGLLRHDVLRHFGLKQTHDQRAETNTRPVSEDDV